MCNRHNKPSLIDVFLSLLLLVMTGLIIWMATTNPLRSSDKMTKDYRTTWTEADVREALLQCPTETGWPVLSKNRMYCTDGETTREIPQRTQP